MPQEKLTGRLLRVYGRKSRVDQVEVPDINYFLVKDEFGQYRLWGWMVEGGKLIKIPQEGYNGEDETRETGTG